MNYRGNELIEELRVKESSAVSILDYYNKSC